jgi:hypothetical protein
MPMHLEGSCRCGAVRFALDSHTPVPYQLCYCSICRKTAGGGGYAINLGGISSTLTIKGKRALGVYQAVICEEDGSNCVTSSGQRHFCKKCGSALWLYDPTWPELVHPFASAIDTPLPVPPSRVHLMLRYKPDWVRPQLGPRDEVFDEYPELSLADWHKRHGVWAD